MLDAAEAQKEDISTIRSVHKGNDLIGDLIGTVLSLFSFRNVYEVKA